MSNFAFERKLSLYHQHRDKKRARFPGEECHTGNLSILGISPCNELYQVRKLSQFNLDRRKVALDYYYVTGDDCLHGVSLHSNFNVKNLSHSRLNSSSTNGGFYKLTSHHLHLRQTPFHHITGARSFSSSSILYDAAKPAKSKEILRAEEKSRVEEAVEAIKEKKQKAKDLAFEYGCSPEDLEPKVPEVPVKKTIWEKVKHEVTHYYNGFKLLYFETRIAMRHLWQIMNGKALTRRERRQVS